MSTVASRRLVLGGLMASLAACGTSPAPRLYTLVARPGVRVDRALPPAVLRSVEVPKYLDRPQIVRHRSAVELTADEFERWDEDFDAMVTRVLLEDLSLRLPLCSLALAGSAVAAARQREIAVALARFDPDSDGIVVLEARWHIDGGLRAPALSLDRITRRAAATTPALVAAMSDCLATLADHIAGALA